MKPLNGRVHDGSSKQTFLFESFCVISAYGLIAFHGYRLSQNAAMWNWSCILAIACGWIAADFVSGLVHWLADTWGSETMPWIGPRFLKPFRVHHTTPESFLECKFMDTNGDTALIGIPFLLFIFAVPLSSHWGFWLALFLTSFCLFALPTNQIHQWAHMSRPPRMVRWLQASGLILSPTPMDCTIRVHTLSITASQPDSAIGCWKGFAFSVFWKLRSRVALDCGPDRTN